MAALNTRWRERAHVKKYTCTVCNKKNNDFIKKLVYYVKTRNTHCNPYNLSTLIEKP